MHSSRGYRLVFRDHSALGAYLAWAVIAVQDPDPSIILDGMSRESARGPTDMSSSVSSPSKLKISDQAELDGLLSGRRQDAREARHNVRSLDIFMVKRVPEEWPSLPCLQDLSVTVDNDTLAEFPRVLRASALPALRSLKLTVLLRVFRETGGHARCWRGVSSS